MPKKSYSSDNPPHWEQPYLEKPELPDWKEFILSANINENENNEFEVLFENTNESPVQRDNLTDRASFMKKDDTKIAQEVRSRLDRALKGYKHEIVDAYKQDNNVECVVKLTSKTNNPKTIVATFSFAVQKPQLFNMNATAEKIEANSTFVCNDQEYPINKHGFDTAFANHGVKYADSHVITTLYQLEETFEADDVVSGIESGQIVPLNEKVYVCEASYLNNLSPLVKKAQLDQSYMTDRHNEEDSDSSLRLQNIEKQEIEIDTTPEVDFGYYSENNLLNEVKTEFGLVGPEAQDLIQAALDQGLLMPIPGGFISEGKFSKKALQAGLIAESRLGETIESLNNTYMTEKIQGEFRHEAEASIKLSALLVTAKSKIDGKNRVVASELLESDNKRYVVKVETVRKVASYEVPVDYYFCFRTDGSLKEGHAVIAGKNCPLEKVAGFYDNLEKEALRQEALEKLPVDHHQELSPLAHNESYTIDEVRIPKADADVEKFTSVRSNLVSMVKEAFTKKLLTEADVEIFVNKIEASRQVSELTQIEKEFKILTDTWSI